ncbi:MAG: helix-turn-helix domain-containing protein [archaeon]|nr:helix-turn-helix domain-containing protein [archaeon]MCP8312987.1 helix-turn-helix domain-containing protein [archaeon]
MAAEEKMVKLLEEILKWIRFSGMQQVKSVLLSLLDSETKRIIYHLSDGEKSSGDIGKMSGVSDQTVRNYWRDWFTKGIVEPKSVKGGTRYKKVFSLEDFGIEVPPLKEAEKVEKPTEEPKETPE